MGAHRETQTPNESAATKADITPRPAVPMDSFKSPHGDDSTYHKPKSSTKTMASSLVTPASFEATSSFEDNANRSKDASALSTPHRTRKQDNNVTIESQPVDKAEADYMGTHDVTQTQNGTNVTKPRITSRPAAPTTLPKSPQVFVGDGSMYHGSDSSTKTLSFQPITPVRLDSSFNNCSGPPPYFYESLYPEPKSKSPSPSLTNRSVHSPALDESIYPNKSSQPNAYMEFNHLLVDGLSGLVISCCSCTFQLLV